MAAFSKFSILIAMPAALVVTLFSVASSAGDCTSNKRQSWTDLSRAQKYDYITAELCLINSPPRNGLRGARSRFEELQWVHLEQLNFIHGVGAFLYWHRYLMSVHERLLQSECGYQGSQPYWDEMEDVHSMEDSEIFDPDTGFGGNGSGSNSCVTDGPFAGLMLHLTKDYKSRPYCLSRKFKQSEFDSADPRYANQCYKLGAFTDAWPCYEARPHDAGHNGVGGVMANVAIAPGDPIFYLHHTYLDKLFWDWQLSSDERQHTVGGPNTMAMAGVKDAQPQPDAAFLVTNGDDGSWTTAEHVLWMAGIAENVTISDVMDITDDVICAEYV